MARSLYRSVTYGLDASLDLARTVAGSGGHTDAESLAPALGYSGVRNGAFLSRLANARLFGLVAGRSGQVVLTDRGRHCFSTDPAVQRRALAEACWAVPLFRRVLASASDEDFAGVEQLAVVLETDFGEDASKSRTTARVLLGSARRAGLLREGRVDLSLVREPATNFTDSELHPGRAFAPSVRWMRNPHVRRVTRRSRLRAGEGGASMKREASGGSGELPSEEGDLWIDEGKGRPGTHRRRTGLVLGLAACMALIGVPVGLLAASGPEPVTSSAQQHHIALGNGPAKRSVLAALSATTDSGSFAFSYELSDTQPTSSSPDADPSCSGPVCPMVQTPQSTDVQGSGTIDTNPMAMAASASLSSNGDGGLQVGVRVDPTTVWEVSNTDNQLTPEANDAGGTPLPNFASLVEGTLGQREGAVAMMGMASPTGYLDLEQPAVTSATQVGTATVDGVAVDQYALTIDPGSLATAPGTSSEEQSTIDAAIATLTAQGYQTIRDLVSIDPSGFIRESSSTVTFGDGGTVTLDAHFSNFGCAGTVLMPGQGGLSNPPAGCVSADTGTAPTTTSTTSAPSTTSTTSTSVQPAPTTIPPATPLSPSTTSTSAPSGTGAATTTTTTSAPPTNSSTTTSTG
jgi:hypothetical protein